MASRADDDDPDKKSGMPWRFVGWGTAALLLVLPYLTGAPWTASDYGFAAAMLGIVGGVVELAARTSPNFYYRAGALVAVAASFLLVWINGAVGIIGDEGNWANLMFFVVIAVALAGSIAARFRAKGMVRAMAVTAAAEALVAVPVAAFGLGANEPPGLIGVLVLIGGFTGMWGLSAVLFRNAANA